MSWNYRVLRTQDEDGPCYAIHECHYDKKGETIPTSWCPEPEHVTAETREGLFWIISVMVEGVAQPVLEVVDGKLVEVEAATELSDAMLAAIKMGKLVGTGDYDPEPQASEGRATEQPQ